MTLSNNFSRALEPLAKLPQQRITQIIMLLLLSYIAYLCAQLTWFGLSEPNSKLAQNQHRAQSHTQTQAKDISVGAIQALNLFGRYNQKQAPKVEQVVIEDAPETRLKLILSGVVASNDQATAGAIIESAGKQETYSIGENIKGTRAVLESVYNDRVILKVSGRFETLMFEGLKFDKNVKPLRIKGRNNSEQASTPLNLAASAAQVIDQRNNKALTQTTKSLRKTLNSDPGKITDYLKISPRRENGKIIGYRLMPGKDPEFFKSAGLKSGDIATQMNGYDLTAPREAAQALKSLKEQREVSLLLNRSGTLTEILFSIDN
ncbi:type II secretion system protein C (GspC) [Colwellia chukchiensis]|uniref:Type II secretion system protein C (GspC) n=1 Tax=Colwellia chukchiensis TaxID=641665 RepID=A0A1H7RBK0_9GAMM|nr:type II secretion system protein GspC [Colwellia chukchiensis]SEL57499.1 type II secretion system protein C (GspC) [Colwellia chukchiensis]